MCDQEKKIKEMQRKGRKRRLLQKNTNMFNTCEWQGPEFRKDLNDQVLIKVQEV